MIYFTTSKINLYFTYNSAKRTLTLKDINDFIRFWHCVKQPFCILTLSNSCHERFCFVLYLWEGRNKRYKATKNCKILMTTVPPGGLFEYTRRPTFASASVHCLRYKPIWYTRRFGVGCTLIFRWLAASILTVSSSCFTVSGCGCVITREGQYNDIQSPEEPTQINLLLFCCC
jgi:hypothetical protein